MLLELLFCTGFFILPLIGMFTMVIAQVMKVSQEEKVEQERQMLSFKRHTHTYRQVMPVFAYPNPKKRDNLLVGDLEHRGKGSHYFKERINPRAGP